MPPLRKTARATIFRLAVDTDHRPQMSECRLAQATAVVVTEQRRRMTCRGGKKLSRLKLGRRTGHADAQPKSGAT